MRAGYPAVDKARLAAALLVVCIHTAPLAGLSAGADLALRTLARLAVPFFLLVTGYFVLGPWLLGRGDTLARFVRKTLWLYGVAALAYLPVTVYAGNLPATPGGLLRDILLDGTFYHLWYLPGTLVGCGVVLLLVRFAGTKGALAVCAALYVLGVGGDSWYGLAARAPGLKVLYGWLFASMDYTRNGLFFAPLFLLLGALAARGGWARRGLALPLAGFGASLVLLFAEAFALHAAGVPRHDSMYLALAPCALCVLLCLLQVRGQSSRLLRNASLLLYLLHPLVIVAVRGAAKVLGLRALLVENAFVHFLAVALAGIAAAFALAALLARRPPKSDARTARAWAEVDLDAIAHNARALAGRLPTTCRLMAVVKADAYGHGALPVAGRLWQAGVRSFAVATLEEGRQLRQRGIGGEILILGYTPPSRTGDLRRWRLSQTVADDAHAQALSAAAGRRPLPVHIAVDTGMHRLGTSAADADTVAGLLALPGLRVQGLFTHLAAADDLSSAGQAHTAAQLEQFSALAASLQARGISLPPLHAQASFGILHTPGDAFALARPGLALYCPPGNEPADLRPALALRARVVCVRRLTAGESAGYGFAFTARRDTLLAVVSIGYADGWPRSLGEGRSQVLLRGRRIPVVGRVCMDQMLIDATDAGAAVGDVVTLLGQDGAEAIAAHEAAAWAGTIPNELLCRLGPRLPRVYT